LTAHRKANAAATLEAMPRKLENNMTRVLDFFFFYGRVHTYLSVMRERDGRRPGRSRPPLAAVQTARHSPFGPHWLAIARP
jgi:hypothetical protein